MKKRKKKKDMQKWILHGKKRGSFTFTAVTLHRPAIYTPSI